jgi:hypothetical protein
MNPASSSAALESFRRARSGAQAAVHPAALLPTDRGRLAGLTAAGPRLRAAGSSARSPIVANLRCQHV